MNVAVYDFIVNVKLFSFPRKIQLQQTRTHDVSDLAFVNRMHTLLNLISEQEALNERYFHAYRCILGSRLWLSHYGQSLDMKSVELAYRRVFIYHYHCWCIVIASDCFT